MTDPMVEAFERAGATGVVSLADAMEVIELLLLAAVPAALADVPIQRVRAALWWAGDRELGAEESWTVGMLVRYARSDDERREWIGGEWPDVAFLYELLTQPLGGLSGSGLAMLQTFVEAHEAATAERFGLPAPVREVRS